MVEDDLGFLWFSTQEGLNRYDGYEFKTFYAGQKVPEILQKPGFRICIKMLSGRYGFITRVAESTDLILKRRLSINIFRIQQNLKAYQAILI